MQPAVAIRRAVPGDYDRIIPLVDDWWGRPVSPILPRLFLDHFAATSRVADDVDGLAGFVIAFLAPSSDIAYIHFTAVRPDQCGHGLARRLYTEVESHARHHGYSQMHAITSPANTASIAFHQRLGFTATGPVRDYNGPGHPMVTFCLHLT